MRRKALGIYGIGPYYFIIALVLEVIGITLHFLGYLDSGLVHDVALETLLIMVGSICVIFGLLLYIPSAFGKKPIDMYIKKDELCTEGMYGVVRNPIYSGITFIFTGIISFFLNGWLFFIPLLDYLILTVLLIATEERWLYDKYGLDYLDYKNTVNRLLPWFRRRKRK